MNLLILVAVLSIIDVHVFCENCDHQRTLIYEDLHCKPVIIKGNDCPIKYDCDNFKQQPDYCLFQSKKVKIGGYLDQDVTYAACQVSCFCTNHTSMPKFQCAILDCPEYLRPSLRDPLCYWGHTVNKCCSTGQICPSFNNITKCDVEGKSYTEGQIFTMEAKKCTECTCNGDFKGVLKEPSCKRKICAVQVRHLEDLSLYAAPVYSKDNYCCPYDFVRHESSDTIKKVSDYGHETTDLQCQYGTEKVKLGYGVEKSFESIAAINNVTCECKVPPLMTCIITGIHYKN